MRKLLETVWPSVAGTSDQQRRIKLSVDQPNALEAILERALDKEAILPCPRRPVAPRFKARVIAAMEGQIRSICREIMAAAADRGDVEFVRDVTSSLPSRVIGNLMGLPEEDLPMIHRLAEMNTSGQDADYVGEPSQGSIDMAMYAIQFAMQRRNEAPREDLTTLLLETDFAALVDRILVVDCPREMQLERLMRRDSMSRPRAVSILAAQIERAARLDAADEVIDNSGTLEHTRVQVGALHARYLELARDCPSPRAGAE